MSTMRMKGLVVCSAVISLLLLISCPSAFASSQHSISIKVFTSPDDQFSVNSIIVEGDHEVMLVDAQLTKSSAEKVLQEIKETKKPLSIIYITHEHADHFLGLEVFKGAYPGVTIIGTSAVVDRINKVYREKLDKWQKILGSGASSQVVEISKFDGSYIDLRAQGYRLSKTYKATPTKTPCSGFPDRESSSLATCCSMTFTSTPRRRIATLERNGWTR